jgi:hypothetical protein
MGRRSKIDNLAQEYRDKIVAWRVDGATIDELRDRLLAEPLPPDAVPRHAAMGVHVQRIDAVIADAVRSRAIATAIGREAADGDAPVAALNLELMQNEILGLLMRRREENADPLSPKETEHLAAALQRLSAGSRNVAKTAREQPPAPARPAEAPAGDPPAPGLDRAAVEEARRIMGFET